MLDIENCFLKMTKTEHINTYIIDDDFTLDVIEDEPENIENAKTSIEESDSESELVIDEDVEDSVCMDKSDKLLDTSLKIDPDKTDTEDLREIEDNLVNIDEIIEIVKATKESLNRATSSLHYRCPICTRYICKKKPKFLRHLEIHLAEHKLYKCEKCTFVTAQESYFSLHKVKCNAHRLKCEWCDYQTFKGRVMKKHVHAKHLVKLKKANLKGKGAKRGFSTA